MFGLSRFVVVVAAVACGALAGTGEVLAEQYPVSDCVGCHVMGGGVGDKTPDKVYSESKTHHPVGVSYPREAADFNPADVFGGVSFFDTNHNGQTDADEVRFFGEIPTLTCASCHLAHEPAIKKSGNNYLRSSMEASELCVVCHRK
jgi:hypothetical protein